MDRRPISKAIGKRALAIVRYEWHRRRAGVEYRSWRFSRSLFILLSNMIHDPAKQSLRRCRRWWRQRYRAAWQRRTPFYETVAERSRSIWRLNVNRVQPRGRRCSRIEYRCWRTVAIHPSQISHRVRAGDARYPTALRRRRRPRWIRRINASERKSPIANAETVTVADLAGRFFHPRSDTEAIDERWLPIRYTRVSEALTMLS